MSAADRGAPLSAGGAEKVGVGDTARAETELPLPPAAVLAFLAESERLFRLNPHLEVERWQPLSDSFQFAATNELNGRRLETAVRIERLPQGPAFSYSTGLKQATVFAVEPAAGGARLVVTEHYPRIEDPDDPRIAEVDRSLIPWVAAIRRHLLARQRWGWLPGWQWWNARFLPGMPPRQRRIVRLIVWIGVFEFAVFLGLVVVLRYAA